MCEQDRITKIRPNWAGIADEYKLYEAYSIVDRFYTDESRAKLHWFCWMREKPIGPYKRLIRDYEPRSYSEYAINEYFTECEIEQLREYLERAHDLSIHIEEIDLPISNNVMPYSAIGSFSMCKIYENNIIERKILEDYHMLSKETGYSLPFNVCGYYNFDEIVGIE